MKINQPNLIKIFAVITAAPRWVIALLAAEGFILPDAWLGWWIVVSAILSLGMAIVEGFAFSYIFNAWKAQKDKRADTLLIIALFSALVFVGVMSPSISAGVRRLPLGLLLTEDWTLHLWSIAVSLSTITIVAGVGYAEKQIDNIGRRTEIKPEKSESSVYLPESIQADERSVVSFKNVTAEDKQRISAMNTREVMMEFGLTERTALNWRKAAARALPAGDGKGE